VAQLCADGLGVSLEEFLRLARGADRDKQTLAAMLKTAGIDPATGRHRGGSAAQAAGIPIPRIGLDAPRVAHAADQGNQGDDAADQDGQGHAPAGDGAGHNAEQDQDDPTEQGQGRDDDDQGQGDAGSDNEQLLDLKAG
jgi:hypothetical protein